MLLVGRADCGLDLHYRQQVRQFNGGVWTSGRFYELRMNGYCEEFVEEVWWEVAPDKSV